MLNNSLPVFPSTTTPGLEEPIYVCLTPSSRPILIAWALWMLNIKKAKVNKKLKTVLVMVNILY